MQAKDKDNYKERATYYHARLLFILRGLNSAELKAIYSTALPMFFTRLDKSKKRKLRGVFEEACNDFKARFIQTITKLADKWIASS